MTRRHANTTQSLLNASGVRRLYNIYWSMSIMLAFLSLAPSLQARINHGFTSGRYPQYRLHHRPKTKNRFALPKPAPEDRACPPSILGIALAVMAAIRPDENSSAQKRYWYITAIAILGWAFSFSCMSTHNHSALNISDLVFVVCECVDD